MPEEEKRELFENRKEMTYERAFSIIEDMFLAKKEEYMEATHFFTQMELLDEYEALQIAKEAIRDKL